MNKRIYILALASFAMGTEAFVFAGHLEALATELGQPVASAGQIATAFALTYALSAPFVAALVARHDRRSVLTVGLLLIGAINLIAAASPNLATLIGLRVFAGLSAGLVGPISSVAAAELAPPEMRGKAMAIVLAGMTLAFVLGIPMGSVIGDLAGWRGTFVYAGAVAAIAAVAIRFVLPEMPGGKRAGLSAFKSALAPAVVANLALTLVGFAATFSTIAYLGPVVTAISGLTGSGIGAMQALIGVGSIFGIALGARMAARPHEKRLLAGTFVVSAAALSLYSILMMTTSVDPTQSLTAWPRAAIVATLAVAMISGAMALFSRTPVIQVRLVDVSPVDARPVILALNGSMVFFGQGLGAAIGGATIGLAGLPYLGLVAAIIALLGAATSIATGHMSEKAPSAST